MKQFNLIKRFRAAIVIAILLITVGIINGCSDSSTSSTQTKDSTTNALSDTSQLKVDSMGVDTTKGEQLPPPK
ncbi:MAG TPA: hypothetical protein VMY77_03545 [Chitinophagaceae bacterium]|nr:hypothetical protein [Chitinophagaceae bacterium]